MTWQCRRVLVSTHFWNRNPPKPVIGPTKYRTKHIYKLTMYRTCSQNLKSASFYFGNDVFESKSNEVEIDICRKNTSLQVVYKIYFVESMIPKNLLK